MKWRNVQEARQYITSKIDKQLFVARFLCVCTKCFALFSLTLFRVTQYSISLCQIHEIFNMIVEQVRAHNNLMKSYIKEMLKHSWQQAKNNWQDDGAQWMQSEEWENGRGRKKKRKNDETRKLQTTIVIRCLQYCLVLAFVVCAHTVARPSLVHARTKGLYGWKEWFVINEGIIKWIL